MARRTNPRTNLSPVRNPRPIKVGPCTRTNRLIRVGVPIEVMTAINCSHEEGCMKRGGGASEREGEGFWARAELGLTGEMGLVVPGHVYLTPLFLFSSFSLSLSLLFSSFSNPSQRSVRVPPRAVSLSLVFSDGRATRMPQVCDPRWRIRFQESSV